MARRDQEDPMIDITPYRPLDRPGLSSFIFHPRQEWTPPPDTASDHAIPVSEDATLVCRFYTAAPASPTVLFFHGNGEVGCDYDPIAPIFAQTQLNLFAADYRGYGASGGNPSFTAMLSDAESVFQYAVHMLRSRGYADTLFVMGRSLGSAPAIALAHEHPESLRGLIIESGFGSAARLLMHLGVPMDRTDLQQIDEVSERLLRGLTLPSLVIHGRQDTIVPFAEAERLTRQIGSEEKTLVPVHRADHNNILRVGEYRYFWALDSFVAGKVG